MVDARRRLVRPLHDHARQHGRERRAAVDPGARSTSRSRSSSGSSRATRSRSARSCSPAGSSPTCFGRRLIFVVGLAIFTLSSLGCGLAGSADRPDRRARRAGGRRGADEPGDALDHHGHVPAAPARHRDRDLGRRVGARARDRPARRRTDRRADQLELDLLHQRPGRSARDPRRLRLHRRVARHLARAAPGLPGPRHLAARPLRAQLRADRGEQLRLDVDADPRRLRRRRSRRSPRSSCSSCTSGCRCSSSGSSATAASRAPTR